MTTTYIRINSEGIVEGTILSKPNKSLYLIDDDGVERYQEALSRFNASYREFEDQERAKNWVVFNSKDKTWKNQERRKHDPNAQWIDCPHEIRVTNDKEYRTYPVLAPNTELELAIEVEEIGQVKLTDGAWRDTEGEYGFSAFEIRDSRTVYRIVD